MISLTLHINDVVDREVCKDVFFQLTNLHISNIYFADDMVIFGLAKTNNVRNILRVIEEFCLVSRQCTNFSKSWIICSNGIPSTWKISFLSMGFVKASSDIKYMGFPYIHNSRFTWIMMAMVDKLKYRIESWTVKPLSQDGRLVMIKLLLIALLIYIMSCYELPHFIINKLHSLIDKFWHHWKTTYVGMRFPRDD